ncbi:pilus assembly protein [Gemmata sp. G18]|uniref:Pilus assembly protein n=1 Tax=Gemmata palustris TaxID=2822762 RepID=A0ABS5BXR1_9BACT|nr:TadE/TadG family type IV pilus assembly protein [Gemmata palustris]MBP3958455.1 pilus assembly protein [Gemmata palustris]
MVRCTPESKRPPRGAAAVELVVLLPFLALLFAAGVDFARVFRATQILQSAASSASSYATGTAWTPASTTTTADAAKAAAVTQGAALDPPLNTSQVAITATSSTVTVTVTYDFPLFCGFIVPGGKVQLQRTAIAPVALRPGD